MSDKGPATIGGNWSDGTDGNKQLWTHKVVVKDLGSLTDPRDDCIQDDPDPAYCEL